MNYRQPKLVQFSVPDHSPDDSQPLSEPKCHIFMPTEPASVNSAAPVWNKGHPDMFTTDIVASISSSKICTCRRNFPATCQNIRAAVDYEG